MIHTSANMLQQSPFTTVIRAGRGKALSDRYVYIGRPSKWGNPFALDRDGDRATVIAKHWQLISGQPWFLEMVIKELSGKILGCYCAPRPCHGDTYALLCNRWAQNDLPDARRASGAVLCGVCQQEYRLHPLAMVLGFDFQPYLHRLCNGELVKL